MTNVEPICPPQYGRPAGRPRIKRIQQKGESSNPYKLTRKYGKMKCSRCQQIGHNSRGCKNSIKEFGKAIGKRRRDSALEIQSSQVMTDPLPQSQYSQV